MAWRRRSIATDARRKPFLIAVRLSRSPRAPARKRGIVIEQLKEAQQMLGKLLALLETGERDRLAAHLYQSAGNTRERAKLPENPVSRLNDTYLDISDRREHGLQRRLSPLGGTVADRRMTPAL